MNKRDRSLRVVVACLGLMACASVAGQTAGPSGSAPQDHNVAAEGSGKLEEVIVSAQKRDENLQRVPITVSAITGAALESQGITNTQNLAMVVPGLIYNRSLMNSTPFLRGVGRVTSTPGSEMPVAQYVDGVYSPAGVSNISELNTVERIEVLKGPQGTLFGRNATGGVINIITRDPSAKKSAQFDVGYANYDTIATHLYGTTAVSDNLAADLAVLYRNQSKGWGFNPTNQKDVRKSRDTAARTKWRWTPSDRTTVTLSGNYTSSGGDLGMYTLAQGAVGLDGSPSGGFYDIADPHNHADARLGGTSMKLVQDLGWAQLTDIVAYQHVDFSQANDADGVAAQILELNIDFIQGTVTNEFQLTSGPGSSLEWIVGVFYMNDRVHFLYDLFGSGFPTRPNDNVEQKTESYAGFAQATREIFAKTRLTLGVRYTLDDVGLTGREILNTGVVAWSVAKSDSFNKITYRLSLDHDFSHDVLGYVSYNRGFKSGGYVAQSANQPVLQPEVLDAYEVGLKTELFDQRVRLNSAAFYYQYDNMIVRSNDPATNRVRDLNAARSKIKGIDLDFIATPGANLTLTGGVELLDAKFENFRQSPLTRRRPAGGNFVTLGDVSGNDLIQSPHFVGQLGVSYRLNTSSGTLGLNAQYSHTGKFYWGSDNRLAQPAYDLINATASWSPPSAAWDVTLWGKNLAGERYVQQANALASFGDQVAPGPPRTYGVALAVHW